MTIMENYIWKNSVFDWKLNEETKNFLVKKTKNSLYLQFKYTLLFKSYLNTSTIIEKKHVIIKNKWTQI